jgi:hypothetical protein
MAHDSKLRLLERISKDILASSTTDGDFSKNAHGGLFF